MNRPVSPTLSGRHTWASRRWPPNSPSPATWPRRDASRSEIEESLQASGYTEHETFAIKLALEEALVNAIKHGNQMDADKRVYVVYHVTPERFDIRITDEGTGFNPEDVPDPTAIENLERPAGAACC